MSGRNKRYGNRYIGGPRYGCPPPRYGPGYGCPPPPPPGYGGYGSAPPPPPNGMYGPSPPGMYGPGGNYGQPGGRRYYARQACCSIC